MKFLATIVLLSLLNCGKNINNGTPNKDATGPVSEKKQSDTLTKDFYSNKKIKNLIIEKDSLGALELHISFHENGNVKEKGLMGIVSNDSINTKAPFGTWFYYDKNKNLDSTIFYNNDVYKKDYIEKKRYSKGGIMLAIEHYNNYVLYENKIDTIGVWKNYSSSGRLLKSVDYSQKAAK